MSHSRPNLFVSDDAEAISTFLRETEILMGMPNGRDESRVNGCLLLLARAPALGMLGS